MKTYYTSSSTSSRENDIDDLDGTSYVVKARNYLTQKIENCPRNKDFVISFQIV